ncbi:VWA domain-containing protein [Actibacterium lipolyticum]|uniref:VWFA domain-containing protein n=1 Tax=Actibacterium lipolyticum TaxID=1524263 RepID=A0A238KQG9_9RHOB|nr:vWA domain-containing protein [Actibacterium lipolyticum]SMX44917.1 hypothetical protein COL8621_02666 [Actibacterium lipolyticum]
MTLLSQIILLRPLWLLALPVIAVLAVLSFRRNARVGDWAKMIDPHLMQAMERLGRVDLPRARVAAQLPFLGAGAIVIALVGPAGQSDDAQTFRNLDGVVFVLDVSDSMTQDARWQDTVTMSRAALSVLGTKPAALVVYAGDSYVASPLTTDTLQLGQTVTLLDGKTIPDKGSRPALALRQAAQILDEADVIAGDVVLMTDGGGLGPEALLAAKDIVDLGGRLLVAHAETTVAEDGAGATAEVQSLVNIGGGLLFQLNEATALMDELSRSDDKRLERQDFRLLFWTDYGRYLLLFALIPIAALFRRERA